MTPKVPSPRHFSTKFPWDCPWRNKNALCTLLPRLLLGMVQRSCCRRKRQIQGTSINPCRAHVQRLLPRDKREAALLRGADPGLISSCARAGTVSREPRPARGGRREGGSDGAVSIPKCSREISPKQLLEERAAPLVYFTRGTGKYFSILKWKINPAEGPWGVRILFRCFEIYPKV